MTAASALGRRSAMRASFIVDLRDDAIPQDVLPRARQHVENVPAAQSAKLARVMHKIRSARGVAARMCVAAICALQSMSFLHCFSTNNVPGVRRELAACKTLAVRSIPVFTMRSLGGLFRAVYDMLLDRFCPGCPSLSCSRGAARCARPHCCLSGLAFCCCRAIIT